MNLRPYVAERPMVLQPGVGMEVTRRRSEDVTGSPVMKEVGMMRFLGMPTDRIAGIGPAIVRLIVGTIMIAHGLQKLHEGIPTFGARTLTPLGIPHADLMAYVVTATELVGGALLIAGLLSRLAALALTIELATTTSLVKSHIGLIAPPAHGAGAELDLALLAGFLTILLAGPGIASLDYLFRIERRAPRRDPARV